MAQAYYSTIFSQSADDVWNVIRDFNNYPVWVDGSGESEIEDGKSGDAVGAIPTPTSPRHSPLNTPPSAACGEE